MDYDDSTDFLHRKMEQVANAENEDRRAIMRLTNMVFGEITLGYRKVDEKAIDPICAPDGTIILRASAITRIGTGEDDWWFSLRTGITLDFCCKRIYLALVFPLPDVRIGNGIVPEPTFTINHDDQMNDVYVTCKVTDEKAIPVLRPGIVAAKVIFTPKLSVRLKEITDETNEEKPTCQR